MCKKEVWNISYWFPRYYHTPNSHNIEKPTPSNGCASATFGCDYSNKRGNFQESPA